jgi:hypothetical protein
MALASVFGKDFKAEFRSSFGAYSSLRLLF